MQGSASSLDNLLKLYREQSSSEVCFDAQSIASVDDVARVRSALDKWGVVFLTEAASFFSLNSARSNLCDAMWEMFRFNLPPETPRPKTLSEWNALRNAKNGFGNASFSYVNKQFTAPSETPTMQLQSDRVLVTTNSVWRVNLELLLHEDNRHTLALLLALTHVDGMVSIDSAKYASNPSPKPKTMTKQDLTVPHVDSYSGGIERWQAMIVDEQEVKLGFVAGSHRREAQKLMKTPKLLSESGYIAISDDGVKQALTHGWIAPPPRALVIWKSGVCHFEASSRPLSGPKGVHVFKSWSDTRNAERLRFIVGTHLPRGLSRVELCQLAVLSEHGAVPDFYRNANKHCPRIWENLVNRKSTQNLVARVLGKEERAYLDRAVQAANTAATTGESSLSEMSPLKKHLYGVTQPLESLPFNDKDMAILRAQDAKNNNNNGNNNINNNNNNNNNDDANRNTKTKSPTTKKLKKKKKKKGTNVVKRERVNEEEERNELDVKKVEDISKNKVDKKAKKSNG